MVICTVAVSSLHAQAFANKGYHARLTALGHATTALTDDAALLFYNPSSIGFSNTPNVFAGYTNLYPSVVDDKLNVLNAAGTYVLNDFGVIGVGISQFSPNFWTERTIVASFATRLLDENFSIGGSAKILGWNAESPQGENAIPEPALSYNGFTIDVGVLYRISEIFPENDFQVGLSILNITEPSVAKNNSQDAILPMESAVGFAYLSHKYNYSILGGLSYKQEDIRITFGTEISALTATVVGLDGTFFVRFGGGRITAKDSQGEYNGGFGLLVNNLSIDYSYTYQAFIQGVGGISSVAVSYEF